MLTWSQWRSLSVEADTHPGNGPDTPGPRGTPRLVHARRYLHTLITGGDLTNPGHPLAWTSPADRSRYHRFTSTMAPQLRRLLRSHARDLLAAAGIDEPLTWTPPAELADGITLPGVDPATLDPDTILAGSRAGQPLTQAATRLGFHVDHIRLAIEFLDLPTHIPLGSIATARLHTIERARAVCTPEFFQRQYLTAGLGLRQVEEQTGIPRHVLATFAQLHGIPLRHAQDPLDIDRDWLYQQYLVAGRSTTALAADLGVTQMALAAALRRHDIPVRAPGVHSRLEMHARFDPTIPAIVRSAVEGTLHGWQRLARFQAAIAYPSMKTAAAHLGIAVTALTVEIQRLERNTCGQLYTRAAFGKPQRPTAHGKALLAALDRPATAAALRQATGPAPPPPDPATLDAFRANLSTRAPARRTAAYPGIDVQPLQLTPALTAILTHLLAGPGHDQWGYALATNLGLPVGTVTEIMTRLHDAGWTSTRRETPGEWNARVPHKRGEGRLRSYHHLTAEGTRAAKYLLSM